MFDLCRETSGRISCTSIEHDASPPVINLQGQTILKGFGIPFIPAGNLFPIPILDSSIQLNYKINMSMHSSANIAEVLLSRQVLKEQDWSGEFLDSMEKGIGRWADEDMQAHKIEYINLSILFTDDAARLHFDADSWHDAIGLDGISEQECERYGAFALETDICDSITIGDKVKELNLLVPGAGFAVSRIIIESLAQFHVFTPQICEALIENVYEDYYEEPKKGDPEQDQDEFVTRKQFLKDVPKEVYEGEYDLETIVVAKGKTEDPGILRLLDDVINLYYLYKEGQEVAYDLNGYKAFGHLCNDEERNIPCLAIFYGEEGGIEHRIFDDERESISHEDHTYISFLHCFDINSKCSINKSALALWWVFRIIVLADQVLQGLGSDSGRDHRFAPATKNYQPTLEEAQT